MKLALIMGAAIAVLGSATANAAPITLDTNPSTSLQQTQNRPCVIGDPSCNNPSSFASTTLAPSESTYTNVVSPNYTVGQIRGVVGNTFSVGIDVNSQGNQQPLASEVLNNFALLINGTEEFTFNTPTQLRITNPGNGFSDAMLNGFDISNFAADARAQFRVSYSNATAGREQFFLIAQQGTTPTTPPTSGVPEPGTLAVVGLGLLGLGAYRRRTRRA